MTNTCADVDPKWDDEDPIILEQPPTWVYWNNRNQVVLRQKQSSVFGYEDDDPFIFLSVDNVPALIAALRQKLDEFAAAEDVSETLVEAEPEAASQPLTNAERQRRHRDRRRNERRNGHRDERNENSLPGADGSDETESLFPSP